MTADRDLERQLRDAFRGEAVATGSRDIHEAAMARAAQSRQHPAWYASARTGTLGSAATPRPRWVLLAMTAVALLLVAFATALLAGALRVDVPSSPLGTVIYETSRVDGLNQIHIHHLGQSDDDIVVDGTCPAISSDGSVMTYVTGEYPGRFVVAGRDASAPVVRLDIDTRINPVLSPDGTKIAWMRQVKDVGYTDPDGSGASIRLAGEIWVAPTSGGRGIRVAAADTDRNAWFDTVAWSPDGTRIAIVELTAVIDRNVALSALWERLFAYQSGILVAKADGTDTQLINRRLGVRFQHPVGWSPDGRWLAFAGFPDGYLRASPPTAAAIHDGFRATDLFVAPTDGSGVDHPLTVSPGVGEWSPVWSPDGDRIAYRAQEWNATIAVRDGTAAARPSLGARDEGSTAYDVAAWGRDGTTLIFARQGDTLPNPLDEHNGLFTFGTDLASPAVPFVTTTNRIDLGCGVRLLP